MRFLPLLLLPFLAMPALAAGPSAKQLPTTVPTSQQTAQNVLLQIDPALQKREGEYKTAVKALTPDQQLTLKSYEGQFLQTVTPETEIITAGLDVKFCSTAAANPISADTAKYRSSLGVLQTQVRAIAQQQRAALRDKRVKDTAAFFNQKMLDDHNEFMESLSLGMAKGMMEASYNNGGFAKTDCAEAAKHLDDAFAEAMGAGKDDGDLTGHDSAADALGKIKDAAAKGDLEAMTQLGKLELSGEGVPKDVDGGIALLQKAADGGYSDAEYMLGLVLATDMFGKAPDKDKAKFWLSKAAAQGNMKAKQVLPQVDTMKPSQDLGTLRASAEKGDPAAEYELGSRYAQGWGVDRKPDEAMSWMLKSAGQGYALAESDLAVLLLQENRTAEAVEWMTKAADQGVTNSQVELAGIYLEGKAVPKDVDKARALYQKAASAGDSRARDALQKLGK